MAYLEGIPDSIRLNNELLEDINFYSAIGAIWEITKVSIEQEDERIKRLCEQLAKDHETDIENIKILVAEYASL